jgi:hypothetical protein
VTGPNRIKDRLFPAAMANSPLPMDLGNLGTHVGLPIDHAARADRD